MRTIGQLLSFLAFLVAGWAAEPAPDVFAGWRIVGGDIIAGPAGLPPQPQASAGARHWPNGRIPYEFLTGFTNRACVEAAVAEWNTRTPIRLAPRTTETDYLVFVPSSRSFTAVGLIGGAQPVFIEDGDCQQVLYRAIVHEIGHSVGLYHEHQRADRDRFIRLLPENSTAQAQDFTTILGAPLGLYDFASVMHYGAFGAPTAGPAIETIPRGIPIGLDLGMTPMLSAGDIDAVQRLYGVAPRTTTFSTNPAGLDVIVDGERRTAPFTVNWAEGSTHTLDVPSPQSRTGVRHEFARWNDDGRQQHTVTAGAFTHLAANFSTYVRMSGVANDPARGTVTVDSPEGTATPADGLRLLGAPVRLRAQAAPGFFLRSWEGLARGNRNPLVFPVFHPDPAVNEAVARFEPYPVSTLTSQPAGLEVRVNGVAAVTPVQFRWEPGTLQTVDYPAEQTTSAARYRLDVVRTELQPQNGRLIAPVVDANVVALYRTEFRLRLSVTPAGAGEIAVAPALPDGYVLAGDRVQLTASPAAGFRFLRWRGAPEPSANPLAFLATTPVEITAEFAPLAQSAGPVVRNAASALGGAVSPGAIVSLFLAGLPELTLGAFADGRLATEVAGVRVMVNGVAAPVVAVAPGQVNAIVPYETPVGAEAALQVRRDGAVVGETRVAVVAAAPGLFTANASGAGPAAALNQDGSFNTPDRPAAAGEVVVLYGTGEGALDAVVPDGSIAAAPLAKPRLPITVEIGGRPARVLYAGPAPGLVHGLVQINAEVPAGVPPGAASVVFAAGTARSAAGVTVSVK
ncbi:MAG: hypothetical protein IT162_13020 [Bryobacterales bacterium]|nr:hypothetical protein [Bryobacterales bacterium]